MAAVACDGDNDELAAVTKSFGLTIDEGIIRGKRLAVYLLDNPEYQEALDKRIDEISSERRAKKGTTKDETLQALGLEPSKELAAFLDQLSEDAAVGGPLSKPYLDAGAMVVQKQDLIPGVCELSAVCFHKTKFAELFNRNQGSSQLNN